VVITPVNMATRRQREPRGSSTKSALTQAADALLDDRDERPGVKFKDADLIGIPYPHHGGQEAGPEHGGRSSVARLIHAESDDIAFVPSAATALSYLICGMDWEPGSRVLTLAGEFPNNIYNAAVLEDRGLHMEEVEWERLWDAVDERTRLVAFSTVNYMSGLRPPLAELAAFLKARNVLLYLDGTQSVGALEFDVRKAQPDILAVHGYKWLLSPNGAGFVYVSPAMRQRMRPTVVGWRSHEDWRSVDHLHHGAPVFKKSAERYEGGMLTFSVLYAMEASVNLMLGLGVENIERRVLNLAAFTRESLRHLGATFPGYDDRPELYRSPILAARFEGHDASQLCRKLKEGRILVSARHGNLRVSPHFYNNEEDVEALRRALKNLLD
jgi:cysteine desulfurase / selenocysteine lyase